ncbi:MAG: hypothetical protein LH471_10655 [Salinibacterium sp.]|nr:hypothetical protein [Salinibacterium sp.]
MVSVLCILVVDLIRTRGERVASFSAIQLAQNRRSGLEAINLEMTANSSIVALIPPFATGGVLVGRAISEL